MVSISSYPQLTYEQSYGVQTGAFARRMEIVRSLADKPIIMGLRSNGHLAVILPSTDDSIEWMAPIAIGPQWDGASPATIKSFAVYQEPVTLVVTVALIVHACQPNSSLMADSVLVAQILKPGDPISWTNIKAAGSTLRLFPANQPGVIQNADCVTIVPKLPSGGAFGDFTVVVAGHSSSGADLIGLFHRARSTDTWSYGEKPPPVAESALNDWRALAPGWFPKPGFFCLASNGMRFATLTDDGDDYESEGSVNIGGLNFTSIACLPPAAIGRDISPLYAGGVGVGRWDAKAIATGQGPAMLLSLGDGQALPSTIIAHADYAPATDGNPNPSSAAFTLLTATGDLWYGRDVLTNDVLSERPVIIAKEVSASAGTRWMVSAQGTNTSRDMLMVSHTDGETVFMTRDGALAAATEPWQSEVVLIPPGAPGLTAETDYVEAVEQQAYRTRLVICSDDGHPQPFAKVRLTASATFSAWINGIYSRMVRDVPLDAMSGPDGAITVVMPTTTLEVPSFSVTPVETNGELTLDAAVVVDPSASVLSALRAVTSVADLQHAKDCHGNRVFPSSLPAGSGQAISFLNEFFVRYDDARKEREGPAGPTLGNNALCLCRDEVGTRMLAGDEALDAVGEENSWTIVNIATVLCYLWTWRIFVNNFQLSIAPGPGRSNYLVVRIGNQVAYACLWIFAPRATIVLLDWILQTVLELPPEKIVSWFGWTFDWEYVGKMHDVTKRLATLAIQCAIDKLPTLADKIEQSLDMAVDAMSYVQNVINGSPFGQFAQQKLDSFASMFGPNPSSPESANNPAFHALFQQTLYNLPGSTLQQSLPHAQSVDSLESTLRSLDGQTTSFSEQAFASMKDFSRLSLGDLFFTEGCPNFLINPDSRSALKTTMTALLSEAIQVLENVWDDLNSKAEMRVISYIWHHKMKRDADATLLDVLCLCAACGSSFATSFAGLPTLPDKFISAVTDPGNTTLEQVLEAARPATRSSGGLSVELQQLSYLYLPGSIEILQSVCRMASAFGTVFQDYIGLDNILSVRCLPDRVLSWLVGDFMANNSLSYFGAATLKTFGDSLACLLGIVYYGMEYAWSPFKSSPWLNMYFTWFVIQHGFNRPRDWYKWNCARTLSPSISFPNAEFGIGTFACAFITAAAFVQGYQPDIPIELRSGLWSAETTIAWIASVTTAVSAIAGKFLSAPASKPYAQASRAVAVNLRWMAFLAKGAIDIQITKVEAYADFTTLNSDNSQVASVSLTSFTAYDDGNIVPQLSFPIHGLQMLPSSNTGLTWSQLYSSQLFAGQPSFHGFVFPIHNNLEIVASSSASGWTQRELYATSATPARAFAGNDGLYVADTGVGVVYLFPWPLNIDTSGALTRSAVAVNLNTPIGVALQGSLLYVTDTTSANMPCVKVFDRTGDPTTPIRTLSGANTLLSKPISVASMSQSGNIVVADAVSGILVFAPNADKDVAPITQWKLSQYVTDLIVDSQGNIVYTDSSSINVISPDTPSGTDPTPSSSIRGDQTQLSPIAIAQS